jgi:IS30 family transposase
MKKAQKLTKVERLEIQILRNKGHSMRSIASALGRSPNTISLELKRNEVSGEYLANKAHQKSYHRNKYKKFQ